MVSLKSIAVGVLGLIGVGFLARWLQAGKGLEEIGAGAAAAIGGPLGGLGYGLKELAGGISALLSPKIMPEIGLKLTLPWTREEDRGIALPVIQYPTNGGPSITPIREEDRAGVYKVAAAGNGWTFAGAGKIFARKARAEYRYTQYLKGEWSA